MKYLFAALVAAVALALPAGAIAGSSFVLHPAGFGPHSYSAWKAQQGLPDSTGSANQALYFQKMTTTATNAAGVAVITGLEGLPLSDLTGLSWLHREDGHCGAGAPRWNIGVKDSMGHQTTLFLGCNAAQHTETGATTNGFGWCKDTQPSPALTPGASDLTITGLSIVFDEGTDTPNPPPLPCAQQGASGGFVFLDNIDVQVNGVDHCWTSASDNGNQRSTACDPPAGTSTSGSTINLGNPAGIAVDPADTTLISGLSVANPLAPPASWLLYPNVIY